MLLAALLLSTGAVFEAANHPLEAQRPEGASSNDGRSSTDLPSRACPFCAGINEAQRPQGAAADDGKSSTDLPSRACPFCASRGWFAASKTAPVDRSNAAKSIGEQMPAGRRTFQMIAHRLLPSQ